MPSNIEKIELEKNPKRMDLFLVKIKFKFPCTWTILSIDNLKEILKLWIKGEELKYPIEEGFKGRWLFFEEIKKVFEEK